MSAKKRTESAENAGSDNSDCFVPNMQLGTPDFNLELLLEECKTKMAEGDKRKISYAERISKARINISRINTMIQGLELKSQQESGQAWMNSLIEPIMAEMEAIFPLATVEKRAMSGSTTLTVSKKGITAAGKLKGVDCRSITFVPTQDGLGIRDYSENTHEYPDGSIGAIAGLNHPIVSVPTRDSIQFIVDWLMK